MNKLQKTLENAEGAARIAAEFLMPFRRPARLRWGASENECTRPLPGDDFVPNPRWRYTHAVTAAAPRATVWPWLVQIGQGRGGFYSYEGLENLIGCDIHNTESILPPFQTLGVGDGIRFHPKMPLIPVIGVEVGRYILFGGSQAEGVRQTWLIYLDAPAPNITRIISRGRADYPLTTAMRLGMGPLLIEPIGFVMERKMLRNMAALAERPSA